MRAALALLLALAAAAAWAQAAAPDERRWAPLARDGLHDPKSPALRELQQPREALAPLPPDGAGNQVNWVEALRRGAINPRSSLRPEAQMRLRETDVYLNLRGSVPIVRFPHREHTEWLDCSNCHERLFLSEAGATPMSKLRILRGELCGQCHGAVAFPLTECARCHNTPRAGSGTAGAQAR
jgi:c(7)-type cytochrome triheme protein